MLGIMGEDRQPENVYTPGDVARRLGISAQALRRLAAGYERVMGELPRDERGRLWPAPAVVRLEAARNTVRAGRYASVEQALSAGEGSEGVEAPPVPARPGAGDMAALTELVAELRGLRESVDGMSERLEALERENRELRAALPAPAAPDPVTEGGTNVPVPPEPDESPTATRETREVSPPGLLERAARWWRGRG